MAKAKSIDLSKLDPAARKRVERVIAPKNKRLALLFIQSDVERWERMAAKEHFESLSRWVENYLDYWATRVTVPSPVRTEVEQAALARDYPLNRRYNSGKLEVWKAAAADHEMSFTEWVERCLNHEARGLK